MDHKMFCFQCEQTAGCSGCMGNAGVCGKTAATAGLQDELTGALIGLARACENNPKTDATDRIIIESNQEISWTLDGEYGGDHGYVCIEARKHAMELVLNNK